MGAAVAALFWVMQETLDVHVLVAVVISFLLLMLLGDRHYRLLLDSLTLQHHNKRLIDEVQSSNKAMQQHAERNRQVTMRAVQSEAQSRALLESAPEAVLLYSLTQKMIIDANQTAAKLFRQPISDLCGSTIGKALSMIAAPTIRVLQQR